METANEWEGDGPARSTTASEQIAEGPQARDSETNDSSFKEDTLDTLQQMLTCETGNTGTEASTPPCDKGAAGQGLHGTSPASDNLDKVKDASSLIQLEARDEEVEADGLERHTELDVTSSDDSGAWETASEESVAFEEATDVKGEKQNENLDSNGNMDINSQKETEDHLKIQKPSGHLEKTGSGGSGQLAEEIEQCCERTHPEDLPSEQAFTDGARPAATESLCNISKTGSEELPPHADEALRKGTVSEMSDPNVEKMLSEESVSHFANTEPQIEKLNDESVEEPGTGGPHVGKSGLHVEEAVGELTGSHEENGSQNKEAVNKGIKTQMEEPGTGGHCVGKSGIHDEEPVSECTGSHQENGSQNEEAANKGIEIQMEETAKENTELQQNESASEQTEPPGSEAVCEMREPHVDKTVPHTEEKVQECRGSPGEVHDGGRTYPDSNELVSIETETSVLEILSEQSSHPMEKAVSDGTGYPNEEVVSDLSKSHAEKSAMELTMSSADTHEPSVEQTLSEEPGPYNDKRGCEDTVTHDGACANDETGTCVGEIVSEEALHKAGDNSIGESGTPTVDTISEETKSMSDHPLRTESKEKCIMNVIQENDNSGHITDQEQGPLGTSTSKEDMDSKTEVFSNEVVGTQSTITKDSGADQKDIAEDQIENDIIENVIEKLLDGDIKDTDSKQTEDVSKETVCQDMSSVSEETAGMEMECAYTETTSDHSEGANKETITQVTFSHTIETTIEDLCRDPAENVYKETEGDSIQVKERANQESVELGMLVGLKELDGEISETPPNVQDPMDIVKESPAKEPKDNGKSWHAEETGLHAPEGDIETTGSGGESSRMNSGEIKAKENNLEANIRLPEHSLEANGLRTSFETDVDQEVSINDGISCMDIDADTGNTPDISEQVPLDETVNKEIEEGESDKAQSLNDTETYSIPGMLVKPIPLRPMVFSYDYVKQLDVVIEPDEPDTHIFGLVDGDESLSDSHQKDITDSAYGELCSLVEEKLYLGFQTVTSEDQKQIQSVMQERRPVGPQYRIPFIKVSEDHKELAEDEPDCFNQGLIFDTGLKSDAFLPNREPLTKPETDNILAQEAMLTVAAGPILTDTTLSHEGPVVGDKGQVDSGIKSGQHAVEGVGIGSPPLLITRQRSYTDPGVRYDNTQQEDQHGEEKPRTRLRSMTPPTDNFTKSFTATSPQAILESKPLEKAQTSIVYPEVDYTISGEQKAEEATSRQVYTFAPTQIFNPLFFVQEGTQEHGFYQGKTLPRHMKEDINKRQIPSPPRDIEVLLKGQQPETISGPSRSSEATVETPATEPEDAHLVTPLWLPPRPLRHAESASGKDFRSLKPNENPLVRRSTVRHKKSTVASSGLRRYGAMNLPTIPQEVPSGETSFLEKSSRPAGAKVHLSNARQRPFPRQAKINEQEDRESKNKSPMERLAEIEESSGKSTRSPEAVLRRDKRSQIQPSTADTKYSIHRRYSTFVNSSSLLYQEYSDVALNQEIQRQKPGDSPAEEKDPGSPRQRRRILSSHDSYLQRLSISSADSLWQDLPKVRDSVTFISMSREEQKLQEAKFELIMSEALYLRSLNIAVDHFQHSTELQDVVPPQDRQWLFSRLFEVRDASNDFLFDLEEEFENNMYTFQVCDVVIRHEPNFRKVYLPYVTNQTYQDRTFQRLMNNKPRFQQVLSKLESDPVCQRLSLKSFLILPFQRITRLRLLLQNILKRLAPGSNEELQATEAHNAIEKLIRDCNEGVQKMRDTEELIHLHKKIQFECKIFPLISASRRLVKHGEVTSLEFNPISFKWKGTTRQVYLHLFSDCLLLSRMREGGRFVVFDHGSDFRVEGCQVKMYSNQKNIFRIFLRDSAAIPVREGSTEGQYIFRTETQSQKLRWIYALMPPKEEIDFMRGDLNQMQCLKSYKARENDELSLEKADILMVTQNSDDGWLCGIRLSDLHSGWFPQCHVQAISRNACLRNLQEEQRLQNARAKLHPTGAK